MAALAVDGPVWLLLCLLLLLPLFMLRRESLIVPIVCIFIGCFAYLFFKKESEQVIPEQVVEITWSDHYRIDGDRLRGFVRTQDGTIWYAVYQFNDEAEKNLLSQETLAGNTYSVLAEIKETERPSHQFAFDMERYLKSEGAVGQIHVKEMSYVGTEQGITVLMAQHRKNLQQHIRQTFPPSLAAEAEALIIGQRSNMDPLDQRAYVVLGITHLFAISGLHIGLLTYLTYGSLFRLGIRKETVRLILIIGLPLYALLAGGAPSVWRAVTTIELLLIVSHFRLRMGLDNAISISLITFVLIDPSAVYQIGFQLSYAAAFALIFSSNILKGKSPIVTSFLITFICQLIVFPLLLYHFFEVSLSSFIMNIFFVPLFSFIILPVNILLLLTTFLPGNLSDWLFAIYTPGREMLSVLIHSLAQLPYQLWNPGRPSIKLMLLSWIGVFSCFVQLEKGKYRKALLCLFVPIILIQSKPYLDSSVYISFIDVGQGDSILIEMPYRKEVYLIDSGGVVRFGQEGWKERNKPFEVGRQIVVPYLKGKGISKIDRFILTHADADHTEGAEEIVEEIRVYEFHISPSSNDAGVMEELITMAKNRKIPILEVGEGNEWSFGSYQFLYLSPSDQIYEGNNDSLVLLMKSDSFKAIFTGDLEISGEEELVKKYSYMLGEINVLKAGHHGSKTSSSEQFIRLTSPELTVFSAGKDNRYGHPHQEVVDRFLQHGLWTLSTADHGTIQITITKGTWKVQNM